MLFIIYQLIPPSKRSTDLYPGLTVIVKLCFTPDLLPLKIMPCTILLSMKILSNDVISTGFGDNLYFSYIEVLLNPRRSLILSSGMNDIADSSLEISIIDPSVEKFALIKNGYSSRVK